MNWKWLTICGVLAASAGLVACGDDEDAPCEVDADCAEGEFCIGLEGAKECEQLCENLGFSEECNREGEVCVEVQDASRGGVTVCEPADVEAECQTDADCGEDAACVGGSCVPLAECETDDDCTEAGAICENSFCVVPSTNACTSTAECIEDNAYCAETDTCIDVSCGSDLNSCSRCSLGPNGGNRSSDGPVIFFPTQVGVCKQDTSLCLPGAAPWACQFSFLAFDSNDDLPTSGLNNRIRVISSRGDELTVFGTDTQARGNNREYTFTACFPETTNGGIGTAVVLRDQANDHSNTLCVSGQLPL